MFESVISLSVSQIRLIFILSVCGFAKNCLSIVFNSFGLPRPVIKDRHMMSHACVCKLLSVGIRTQFPVHCTVPSRNLDFLIVNALILNASKRCFRGILITCKAST